MFAILLALAAVLLAVDRVQKFKRSHQRGAPLPPRPPSVPLLGNIRGVNKAAPYLTYTEWSKTYGDIIYTCILGREVVILNSEQVVDDLLEKRSQKYSDRPVPAMSDMFGLDWVTTTARYGPRFKLHRRLLHQVFHAKAAQTYHPKQLRSAYDLLSRLLTDPLRYDEHFTTFSASLVMSVTYGYDMPGEETFVTSMKRAGDMFFRVATPELGAMCTAFPIIKSIPAWFPGMRFKCDAAECRRLAHEALHAPYAWVKRQMEEGSAAPSMVADAITRYRLYDDSKDPVLVQAIKETAGTLYGASVETTNSTFFVFVYLMMNHPEVQDRAQAEIDQVVGRQRLPDFEDRASMPYVDAVMRETIRWHPVAPIVPHANTEDDVYRGYLIPGGAIVAANVWAISHNESKYPDANEFIPERFLQADGTLNHDNVPWIFGFGRRICPGRHVADNSLWCAMVCILALFRIEKTQGSEDVKWSTGFTSHPLRFPCRFVPRDEEMDMQKLASLIYASRVEL